MNFTPVPTTAPTVAPTIAPTQPPSSNYVAPSGGVTELGPTANNQFSSSLLSASSDGTFVVQSGESPAEPPASSATLTEYDVTASESVAGQKPGSARRIVASTARPDGVARLPYRLRMDYGTASTRQLSLRSMRSLSRTRMTSSVRRPSAFSQGAQRVFHVLQGAITGNSTSCTAPQQSVGGECYLDVNATLQYVSSHGYVWVDNGIDASYNLGPSDWSATGARFDQAYAKETVTFGPAFFQANYQYSQCDTSGNSLPNASYQAPVDMSGTDPHISILVTKALENTGEGGYFFAEDLLNDQELNCATKAAHVPSNALPVFIIGADKYQTSTGNVVDESFWRTQDMVRSLPHEFQHLLHAVNKVFIPNLVSNQQGVFDDSFVDEGDAMLAQDLVNPGEAQDTIALESAFSYLYSPSNYSLTAFTGYDANPLDTSSNPSFGFFHNTNGNYGAAYLFQRYLYDRFGGDAAMHRQYASMTTTPGSGANIDPVVAEAGNGETFAQLYQDFASALAARKVASTDPRFTFNSSVMLVGTKQVAIPGGQTWDLVMNGPRSPADLTSSQPFNVARIKLTPNSTVSAKLIIGATLFFNAAPSGGSITALNSTSAPSGKVEGALTQGNYGDSGACFGPAPQC